MCTIRTNAFKKFPLEDRALAREKTREGESERRSIVGVYLRPACFIFKTVNSLWFCNLFFVPVAKRPSTRRRCTALRLPAFRRAEELRSLPHSFVRSFTLPSCFFVFSFFLLFPFFFLSLPLFPSFEAPHRTILLLRSFRKSRLDLLSHS